MKFWKYRWALKGAHIHATVFVANHPDQTYSNCGAICMDEDEWTDFQSKLDQYTSVTFEKETQNG